MMYDRHLGWSRGSTSPHNREGYARIVYVAWWPQAREAEGEAITSDSAAWTRYAPGGTPRQIVNLPEPGIRAAQGLPWTSRARCAVTFPVTIPPRVSQRQQAC